DDSTTYSSSENFSTDANGRVVASLRRGRWSIAVHHQELGRASAKVDAREGPARPIELVLDPGVRLSGTIDFVGEAPKGGDRWYLSLEVAHADSTDAAIPFDGNNWIEID